MIIILRKLLTAMNDKYLRNIPLTVTVGQVVIFPYYTIWLKEITYSYTLFAWMFAIFSFSSAWGYRVYHSSQNQSDYYIPFIYIAMGLIYTGVGVNKLTIEYLPYAALLFQLFLGFLQGYFKAWHIKQKVYSLHATQHYLIVGFIMIGLSFIKVMSPNIFLGFFGIILLCNGFILLFRNGTTFKA